MIHPPSCLSTVWSKKARFGVRVKKKLHARLHPQRLPAGGSAAASSAGSRLTCGEHEFKCCRCDRVCNKEILSKASAKKKATCSTIECYLCERAYTNLANRWVKERKLKSWWNNLAEDARTGWYAKHRDILLKRGKKRGVAMIVSTVGYTTVSHATRKQIRWPDPF